MTFSVVHGQMKPIYQLFVLGNWSCLLPHLLGGDITGPHSGLPPYSSIT